MYEIKPTTRFKKDLRSIIKRGYNIALLNAALVILASGEQLPEKYKDHSLGGNWVSHRECHITPDWLLVYKIEADILV